MPDKRVDKRKLYFIALVPPSPWYEQTFEWKHYCANEYNTKGALKSPPHITLYMPFEWTEEKENVLMKSLTEFSAKQKPFELTFDNFSSFPPRVIFIAFKPSAALTELQKTLMHFCRTELNLLNTNNRDLPYHPHLTIAFRDLRKADFHRAWEEFKDRKMEGTFLVNNLVLLKHNGAMWESYRVFDFASTASADE